MTRRRYLRLAARKGLALPIAIGSIVLIGMIVTGVFFAATQENRIGRNTITQEKAFRAAEFGLNNTYAQWNNSKNGRLPIGGQSASFDDSSARGWTDSVQTTRLNTNLYMLVSTGFAGTGLTQARHRTSSVLRINFPQMSVLATLTVRSALKLGGSSFIDGHDTPPAGWTDCPPPGPEQAGIATPDASTISLSGCTSLKCVDGSPDVKQTPAAGDTSTYFDFGNGINWQNLTAAATLTFPASGPAIQPQPTTTGGFCSTGSSTNWGDPTRSSPAGPCESYFPVIYVSGKTGSTHVSGGVGQGVLLVDGDLLVDGGFQWYGPVIVRGHLSTQGTGGHFNGTVMAADVDLEASSFLGNALATYSSCANADALFGAGVPKKLLQRAWSELYY